MIVDLRIIARHLGLLMFVVSAFVLAVAVFAFVDAKLGNGGDGSDLRAFIVTVALGVSLGGILVLIGRGPGEMVGQREALLLVALSWLLGAVVAASPYYMWSLLRPGTQTSAHDFDSFTNCYFEAMSGLTTTGATVVQSLATLPRSLLLWRALTQWLGGLGIVVLFVAVLPMLGVGGKRVFRAEVTGPAPEGVVPRIQDTARILWLIYVGLTILEVVALRMCGMRWFDAVCHTFTTLATGGFGTLDASIGGFNSTAIHITIIVFMFIAGVNFSLYYQLIHGDWRALFSDAEFRTYTGILAVAALIVTVSLVGSPSDASAGAGHAQGLGTSLKHAVFQVVSIQTTTGFCTADFDAWSYAAKATLVALMFIGGSAGSTSGGIKVVRILIAAKVLIAELEQSYRPKVIRSVKIGAASVDADLKRATLVYIIGFLGVFALGTNALMLCEAEGAIDISTAATAAVTTMSNIGPGLGKVGASQNYAWLADSSKIVLCVLMVVGRLEMFAIVALFSPRFWRVE